MRFLRLTAMAALAAAAMVTAAQTPAEAATTCTCTNILISSGYCTEYGNCHELEMIAASPFRPVRGVRDCRGSQQLICDGSSCKIVCPTAKK
jgi:uncharacterized protein YraI